MIFPGSGKTRSTPPNLFWASVSIKNKTMMALLSVFRSRCEYLKNKDVVNGSLRVIQQIDAKSIHLKETCRK